MKNEIKQILREGLIREERIKFAMNIPSDIIMISKIFKENNYEIMVVGGAVRDALLGKSPKDFDLATDAVPDKVEEMMKAAGLRTIATGKAFGVINVFTDQGEYEIATYREDIFNEPTLDNFKTYLKSLNNGKYKEFLNYLMK
jgi:tRNA nucleotidyltransferase/poly(A) polymerase